MFNPKEFSYSSLLQERRPHHSYFSYSTQDQITRVMRAHVRNIRSSEDSRQRLRLRPLFNVEEAF